MKLTILKANSSGISYIHPLYNQHLFLVSKHSILLQENPTGFPGDSAVENPPVNAGDVGSIPGLGRSPAEGNGNPLQYSCLGNSMDRGACWASINGVTK